MIRIYDVIMALRPNSKWYHNSEGLHWLDEHQTKPTEKEIQEKTLELESAEPMRLLRLERNRRLTETDWVVIRAYSQKQDVAEDWINYMQALRDLPATAEPQLDDAGNLTNVSWPEVPA